MTLLITEVWGVQVTATDTIADRVTVIHLSILVVRAFILPLSLLHKNFSLFNTKSNHKLPSKCCKHFFVRRPPPCQNYRKGDRSWVRPMRQIKKSMHQ